MAKADEPQPRSTSTPERVVFPTAVEGLLRATGEGLTPALKATLRGLELDVDKPFPPAWDGALFPRWVQACAAAAFPNLERGEALRHLGRRFLTSWQSTVLGAATSLVMRTIGPQRALSRLGRAFRTGDNFTDVTIEHTDEHTARVTFADAQGIPTYFQGILEAGSEMIGAKGASVTFDERQAPPSATLWVRYST